VIVYYIVFYSAVPSIELYDIVPGELYYILCYIYDIVNNIV